MNITFIPGRSITLVTSDFRVLTATSDNPNWPQIETAIKARDEDSLIKAISIKESVRRFGTGVKDCGNITIKNDVIYYRGEKLFDEDVNRILAYLRGGFPVESMILFLEAKLRNKFPESVHSLYSFLENKGMPLTDNGTILGYKGVGVDYFSINSGSEPLIEGIRNLSGQIRNQIGDTVWMDRRYVCADNTNPCGPGLHIGSKDYATSWAGAGHVMVVEFSPEHVVSVPNCEHSKLRAYKYKVVGELNGVLLGDTYNNDFVRPENSTDPDTVEITDEKDWSHLFNISDWTKGQSKGVKDGKAHQKRLFYECDKGRTFKKYSTEFVAGYLAGYRAGRG